MQYEALHFEPMRCEALLLPILLLILDKPFFQSEEELRGGGRLMILERR